MTQEQVLAVRTDHARRLNELPLDIDIVRVWEGDTPRVAKYVADWLPPEERVEIPQPQTKFYVHIRGRFCLHRLPSTPLFIEDLDVFLDRYIETSLAYVNQINERRGG
jgi:hypothetical protein